MHFPVYSYAFTRSSHSLICIFRSVATYYWSGIGRGSQASGGTQSSLCSILQFRYLSCYSLFLLFPWFCTLDSVFASFLYSSGIMCGHLYVVLQWYWFIVVDFIPFSCYFRLSVCAWGILLTYIRRWLSSRLRFHVFWEAGRDMDTTSYSSIEMRWIHSKGIVS